MLLRRHLRVHAGRHAGDWTALTALSQSSAKLAESRSVRIRMVRPAVPGSNRISIRKLRELASSTLPPLGRSVKSYRESRSSATPGGPALAVRVPSCDAPLDVGQRGVVFRVVHSSWARRRPDLTLWRPWPRTRPNDPARSRDLARLRDLTSLHLPHPSAPIQQALTHMTPDDRAETIAILGRLGDPDASTL